MTFNQLKIALYATYLTNLYGFKLRQAPALKDKKRIRTDYATKLLEDLNIEIKVINEQNIPKDGQYLLASNHRTIIDPLIVEDVTRTSNIQGYWIAKKELYNSFFFGMFVRNCGTILIDREASQISGFFKEIKKVVKEGDSICIFPEGSRNNSDEALGEFKPGAQLIAVKNRLDILPVYIRNRADKILAEAVADSSKKRIIEVEIGELISYKDREVSLEDAYRKRFNI